MIRELRAWAETHAERGKYTPVGIAFHWLMAALVLFQLGWGFYTGMIGVGGDKIVAYQVHAAAGLPILLLAVARLAWRIVIPGPVNDADRLGAQTHIARAIHVLFYLSFFGLPLSGWLMWSSIAEPGPLYLAGLLPWPAFPLDSLELTTRWAILDIAEDVHWLLVWMLVIIVPLHVVAALKHHFWDRHDVLKGMLPEIADSADRREATPHKPRAAGSPPAEAGG